MRVRANRAAAGRLEAKCPLVRSEAASEELEARAAEHGARGGADCANCSDGAHLERQRVLKLLAVERDAEAGRICCREPRRQPAVHLVSCVVESLCCEDDHRVLIPKDNVATVVVGAAAETRAQHAQQRAARNRAACREHMRGNGLVEAELRSRRAAVDVQARVERHAKVDGARPRERGRLPAFHLARALPRRDRGDQSGIHGTRAERACVLEPVLKHGAEHAHRSPACDGAARGAEAGDEHTRIVSERGTVSRELLTVGRHLEPLRYGPHERVARKRHVVEPMIVQGKASVRGEREAPRWRGRERAHAGRRRRRRRRRAREGLEYGRVTHGEVPSERAAIEIDEESVG